MKKPENFFEKMFGSFAVGNTRVPLHSNIMKRGGGYSRIGTTTSSFFNNADRESSVLGNASASNRLTGFYDRIAELKSYQLVDISKLATNFFADYIVNFLSDDGTMGQLVTILNEDGTNNDRATKRINSTLSKDINILKYIKAHVQDYVYYGSYFSMLGESRDETGHLVFSVEEINDPVSVVKKRKKDLKTGKVTEVYLAKGDDGAIYEIPSDEVIFLAQDNLRLTNDLSEGWNKKNSQIPELKKEGETNRDKVLKKESFTSSEPLLYSLILKIKELVIKELLVSLISLRDLSSTQIFLLQVDKSISPESANELCARATKLANNTNELATFLSSQFDVVSFIENTMTKPATFVPDYNSTLGGKNVLLPLDKLSDKILEIMQTIDQCKGNILSSLGLPAAITESSSGNKWAILQQSERANSKTAAFMVGIKDSVLALTRTVYKKLYNEEIDPSRIRLHICEKTSVEYNNQINQADSVNGLLQGISNIVTSSLQVLDNSSPLIDARSWLTYVQNLIRDIDPNSASLITEQSIDNYVQLARAKFNQQCMQLDLDPNQIQWDDNSNNEEGEGPKVN